MYLNDFIKNDFALNGGFLTVHWISGSGLTAPCVKSTKFVKKGLDVLNKSLPMAMVDYLADNRTLLIFSGDGKSRYRFKNCHFSGAPIEKKCAFDSYDFPKWAKLSKLKTDWDYAQCIDGVFYRTNGHWCTRSEGFAVDMPFVQNPKSIFKKRNSIDWCWLFSDLNDPRIQFSINIDALLIEIKSVSARGDDDLFLQFDSANKNLLHIDSPQGKTSIVVKTRKNGKNWGERVSISPKYLRTFLLKLKTSKKSVVEISIFADRVLLQTGQDKVLIMTRRL